MNDLRQKVMDELAHLRKINAALLAACKRLMIAVDEGKCKMPPGIGMQMSDVLSMAEKK